jgi:hypothetical protein
VSQYEWSNAYQQAESEQDISKLEECVMAVERALFMRMTVLSAVEHPNEEVKTELQDIRAAVKGRLRLKTERLKWPGIESDAQSSDWTP